MTPYIQSGYRVKDDLVAFQALRHGLYHVDAERTIDRMAATLSPDTPPIYSRVAGHATLGEIRKMMIDSQSKLADLAEDLEDYVAEAKGCSNALSTAANETVWRLRYDLMSSAVFATLGVLGFATKRKMAGLIGLLAAGTTLFSFLDELDIRVGELDSQFDYLREVCHTAAAKTLDFSLLYSNHNFLHGIMKRRFGRAFTHGEVEYEDGLSEAYDPEAATSGDGLLV